MQDFRPPCYHFIYILIKKCYNNDRINLFFKPSICAILKEDDEVINVCRAWENALNKAKTESEARGEAKGKDSERLNSIRNVMKSLNVTVNRAMEILCIPADEQKKYISLL